MLDVTMAPQLYIAVRAERDVEANRRFWNIRLRELRDRDRADARRGCCGKRQARKA